MKLSRTPSFALRPMSARISRWARSRAIRSVAPCGASARNPGSRSCSCRYIPPALPPITGLPRSIPSGTFCQTLPWWILAAKRRSGRARDHRSRGDWQAGSYPSKNGWASGSSPELLRTVPGVLTLRDRLESLQHVVSIDGGLSASDQTMLDQRRPGKRGFGRHTRSRGVRVSIIRRLRILPGSGVGQRHNRVERRYGRQTTAAGSWRSVASGLLGLPG